MRRLIESITEGVGIRVVDSICHDTFLFRGPHGRIESLTDKTDKDDVGHWTRGAYIRQDWVELVLRKAKNGSGHYDGWHYVTRDDVGDPEPLVIEISEPVRCTLCHERFPSGNAFGWHLADVHEIDTDDKDEYSTTVPSGQRTLGGFAEGNA